MTHLSTRLAAVAPEAIVRRPSTWPTMAYERKHQGDHAAAAHWEQRVLSRATLDGRDHRPDEFDLALTHLLRAAGGEEDLGSAVDTAHLLVDDRPVVVSYPRRALLLAELGAAETWLGRLDAAASHLAGAVAMCRAANFGALLPDALSRLAVVELMRAGHAAAIDATTEVLGQPVAASGAPAEHQARAALVLSLARQQTLPWALNPPDGFVHVTDSPDTDAMTGLLRLVLSARLAGGKGVDGRTVLDGSPQIRVDLPPAMAVVLDLERCAYAIEAGDVVDIRALSAHLSALGATAESACLDAVVADMEGDLAHADALFDQVVTGALEPAVPLVLPHALVCAAQIADSRGGPGAADVLVLDAVRATEPQRYAVPFLGWSAHGTPVPVLLARLQQAEDSAWRQELYSALADAETAPRARKGARVIPRGSPGNGAASVSSRARPVIPPLTPRENDVLFELAHGSACADIAEALFITENTVKTHVSSAYAKLGVTRRSQALRAARAARLI